MAKQVMILVGTKKGIFLFHSDEARQKWRFSGPHLAGWEVSSLHCDTVTGRIWAGTNHYAYGPTFRVSDDLGETWTQLEARPAYPSETGWQLKRIWQIAAHPTEPGVLFAGVEEAGLFVSRDQGASWQEVSAITRQPGRGEWFPGAGGLCLHTILIDPTNPRRMWVGISAVGAFRTEDGGATWQNLNRGLPSLPTGASTPEAMCCVHKMVLDPRDPSTIFMQYHGGVFRSGDGGDTWRAIEAGLNSNFGFPMVISPNGELFIAPLESDEQRFFPKGRAAIYRSADSGLTWQAHTDGLPTEPYFAGVLRDAMAVDCLSQTGVYVGTTAGDMFCSTDAGKSWRAMPGRLPRIATVHAMVYPR